MELKRYKHTAYLGTNPNLDYLHIETEKDDNGEWVKYEDVEQLEQENKEHLQENKEHLQENKEHLQENKKKDEYIQILKNRIDAYDVLVRLKNK